MRIAVFASGSGSNFQAIVESFQKQDIPGELACLFCDQPNAYVIERAKKENIPYFILAKQPTQTKSDYELQLIHLLRTEQIDLVVLAGYMKILGPDFLAAYPNRVLNLHPSLLPKFPGKQGIKDAYDSLETETGITIHLVDSGVDTGPIIFQKKLKRVKGESLEELEQRIHELEHRYYPKVIGEFIREIVVNDK
ncbi:phosphoribosylglycinamide formyltransferase [Vagococcus sp. DIV0080]|uniref:Phosphoribosylglycinamide formyltransferase n=1 Tax=Candidatus Vagococcus giribetii TaxID=2230876 RepID=A0ABS3HV02_9ENTE|nr:phosphoribosylglycinamide formyltransferase [Vagococcus sp. DIV0080]MBO0477491.1 phosphoribosylglycinamide formyltransferase [Vagococcus sp. DIV0080]